MATVCDYCSFRDGEFDLQIGSDIDITLSKKLEGTPKSGEGVILIWRVRRRSGSGSVTYEVSLNGREKNTFTMSSQDAHTVHETFETSSVISGENDVTFKVIDGSAPITIGDVAMLFRQGA